MIVTEEPPQESLVVAGIDPNNYALDQEKTERFKKELVSLMPMIEAQRVPLEERWNRIHHAWARKNTTDSRFYTGINDAYLPEIFKNIEALVAYLQTQSFPAGPVFAIRPSNPMTPPAVLQKVSSLYTYYCYQAKLEEEFTKFLRQAVLMGPTVAKEVWQEQSVRVFQPQLVMDPATQLPTVQPMPVELVKFRGPTFRNVDILGFYIYPFNAPNIHEAKMVYEKIDMDVRAIMAKEGQPDGYLGTDRLKNAPETAQTSRDAVRRDTNRDFRTSPYGLSVYQVRDPNIVTVNEIWCQFDLYGDGYLMPCKAVVANDVVLQLKQNPFWYQEDPYLFWRAIDSGDHVYGMGFGELGEHHQYIINAFMNQGLDALLYQANQMMAIDADRYQGRLSDIQYAPLTVMPFSGPGAVEDAIMFHKPENTAVDIFPVVNLVSGSLSDTFGTPPVTRGQFSNKERTATEVNAVAQGATIRIDTMVRSLGLNVLQPWYERAWKLSQQAVDQMMEFKITGMPPIQLAPGDVNQELFFQPLVGNEAMAFQQQQAAAQAAMQAQLAQGSGPGAPSQNRPGQQMSSGPDVAIGNSSGTGGGTGPG